MIWLYALETTGERRLLATRETTSATFETQCQAWTEKYRMPLAVIREATRRTPRCLKVFYPRDGDAFEVWQRDAAAAERTVGDEDILTGWYAETQNATMAMTLLKREGEMTYPREGLPYGARPNCNCRAAVIPYLRTFKNGTQHVYIDCSVCGKSTEGAVKRTLLPNAMLKALFTKEHPDDT